ncbi:RAMP superfamily CRISPR-associated protein [Actinopolyspora sp. H202]|uniref:RAMP superfamily CRISPR-associated protein n=1 Tax=Actinopolyspora sp. H202 TaxID=1500456 RepID=UPI003EE763FA
MSTSTLRFDITFHTPFRVSTGHARDELDAAIDPELPLPSTSLKGLMRATAVKLLGKNAEIVGSVFGSPRHESPWRWSDAAPDENGWHRPKAAARLEIDRDTHTAKEDMLGVREQIGAEHAWFTVTERGFLDDETLRTHRLVLAVAARATRSLGADRRRGLGWVTISSDIDIERSDVETFLELGAA